MVLGVSIENYLAADNDNIQGVAHSSNRKEILHQIF